jgi:hypothetical protein
MPRCAKTTAAGRSRRTGVHLVGEINWIWTSCNGFAAADTLLFVEGQRLQPHQWNVQLNCPATRPTPAADLTLTKDVQYSLAPDERGIHELLKPTRPI